MSDANIILTGFMGTGKSTVGRLLAKRTGRPFIDTDALIEERSGKSIAAIFAEQGEPAFRRLEGDLVRELQGTGGRIVATGGGMLIDPANAAALGASGPVFCLIATAEAIVERLRRDGGMRPLLDVPDPAGRIGELLEERATAYNRFIPVDTTGRSPGAVADHILALLDAPALPTVAAETLPVRHPQGEYPVLVGGNLLNDLRRRLDIDGPLAVITDRKVGALLGGHLADAEVVVGVPAGEAHKNLDTIRHIYTRMLDAGCDRQTTVVGLGGGVVGDMAGFAAATYMRGVDFVPCPTTLLSMVDASVGGKTGVDMPQGKNLVGAFKQPRAVVADVGTLATLPPAELAAGFAEVIKHGLLADPGLLEQVDHLGRRPRVRNEELSTWQALVLRAIRVKRDVVEEDPFESGRRAVLNLGHTFAHAIERVSDFAVTHGEAVAIGLVAAADLSARLGHADPALVDEVRRRLAAVGLPRALPHPYLASELYAAMSSDKKKKGGRLRFILLRRVGAPFITSDVPVAAALATLESIGALHE